MTQLQSTAGSFVEARSVKPSRKSPAEWQRAHDQLLRLARSRAGFDFEEGRWLLRACQSGVHARLGFGSFSEYVGRLFGYGARLVQEKLRVAEALERLPAFAEALKQGQICWSALRELTRVATPQTEADGWPLPRGARSATWKSSCLGLLLAVSLATWLTPEMSDTCFVSRSVERCWPVFARRSRRCAATRATRSTMRPLCC